MSKIGSRLDALERRLEPEVTNIVFAHVGRAVPPEIAERCFSEVEARLPPGSLIVHFADSGLIDPPKSDDDGIVRIGLPGGTEILYDRREDPDAE